MKLYSANQWKSDDSDGGLNASNEGLFDSALHNFGSAGTVRTDGATAGRVTRSKSKRVYREGRKSTPALSHNQRLDESDGSSSGAVANDSSRLQSGGGSFEVTLHDSTAAANPEDAPSIPSRLEISRRRRSQSRGRSRSCSRARPPNRRDASCHSVRTTVQPNQESWAITQEQRDRISELVLPHFDNNTKSGCYSKICCCSSRGRNSNDENSKTEQDMTGQHFRCLAHGKLTTLLLMLSAWGGATMSILCRQSIEFVILASPWQIAPIYEEITSIGAINVNLCYNQTMIEMDDLADDIVEHASDVPCFNVPLNVGDMDDAMYKLAVSFMSAATYLGVLMTAVITTIIFWQTMNIKAAAVGFLLVYALQSLTLLFFDTDLCHVHQCQLGEGAIYSIGASIFWMSVCVLCVKIDTNRKQAETEQLEAKKQHKAKGTLKRLQSTCGAEGTVSTENVSIVGDDYSSSEDIEQAANGYSRKRPDLTQSQSCLHQDSSRYPPLRQVHTAYDFSPSQGRVRGRSQTRQRGCSINRASSQDRSLSTNRRQSRPRSTSVSRKTSQSKTRSTSVSRKRSQSRTRSTSASSKISQNPAPATRRSSHAGSVRSHGVSKDHSTSQLSHMRRSTFDSAALREAAVTSARKRSVSPSKRQVRRNSHTQAVQVSPRSRPQIPPSPRGKHLRSARNESATRRHDRTASASGAIETELSSAPSAPFVTSYFDI